jgi:hypothetical protein
MENRPPLPRLSEQCIRNAIALNLRDFQIPAWTRWGMDEFFMMWDGLFPYENRRLELYPNTAINTDERTAIQHFIDLLNEADLRFGDEDQAEEFLASDIPARLATCAAETAAVMEKRGRFSETVEEQEPSERFA